MTELLTGLEGVICSMDDVLVYGTNEANHDERLRKVMERIRQSGLKLNKAKCSFRKDEVTFLGHVITGQGIRISPAKVEAVQKLAAPTDVTELRKILGMITYLTKFMPNAQDVLQPLNVLLQADVAWTWDKAQEDAFRLDRPRNCCRKPLCWPTSTPRSRLSSQRTPVRMDSEECYFRSTVSSGARWRTALGC